jgi:protein O-mannosyl-transferase
MTPTRSASAPAPRGDSFTVLAVCVALAGAVAALYAQTGSFEFVSLDDYNILLQRPIVRNGLSAAGVGWALTTADPNWHPVTWLSHMLDFTLFGANGGAHHLVNAGLHAANAVLLFLALRALSGALWPSALAAALFALHPMRAESVAWVVERKDTMSGLFWMLALLAYAAYARRPSAGRYTLVCVAFLLGLMSKTMVVSLPVVLLLLDVWPLERWHPFGAAAGRRDVSIGRLLVEKLPLVGVTAAASALTVFVLQTMHGLRSTGQVGMGWRLVVPPLAYVAYLAQTLWPTHLAFMYPHPALLANAQLADYVPAAIGATLLLAAITAVCLARLATRPYLAVGWLWYLVTLLPVIGIVQVGTQSRADRFTYLPLIGIDIMVAWGLRDVVVRWPRARPATLAGTALALAALTLLSWRQIGTWRDSHSVYEHAIAVTDDNYFAHQVLGADLRVRGQLDQARQHFEAAIRIRPDEAYAHEQYGLLLETVGDRERAAAEYETAVRLSERSYYARANLGAMRLAQGQLDEAVALLTIAARDWPNDAQVQANLGTALLKQERYADAAPPLERAVGLMPGTAQYHNNYGVALAKQGRYEEAAAQFQAALTLNPNHPTAATSLQWVRSQMAPQ